MAFSEEQTLALSAKLNARHVKAREADGKTLLFVEGWHAIAEANRIFGFDGWDRTTLAADCVWSGTHRGGYVCVYTAKVQVHVRAGATAVRREGCGSGEGKGQTPGEAHDMALKAAETDATKRALATFGNPFGLALYDRDLKGVRGRGQFGSARSEPTHFAFYPGAAGGPRTYRDPAAFARALREALERSPSLDALYALWERNIDSVRALGRNEHKMADTLVACFKARAVAVTHSAAAPLPAMNGHVLPSPDTRTHSIDKSALMIGEPKRLRSKDHLRYVAEQPCLVCGRNPVEAHHVRFAQPRAMARKPGDDFAVPLCALHHRALHNAGDEKQWWQARNIDPLPVAARLWRERAGTSEAAGG